MSMTTSGRNDATAGHHPRRDRLERIANAERDRRAGRSGMAIAALGEPTEWPARVVMALSRWSAGEASEAKQVLEEGLDLWAEDLAVGSLDHFPGKTPDLGELSSPIEASELDLAFDTAQTEVESMRDVNDVAAEILADEPVGLAELSGDVVESAEEMDAASAWTPAAPPPSADKTSTVLATLERWLVRLEQRRMETRP